MDSLKPRHPLSSLEGGTRALVPDQCPGRRLWDGPLYCLGGAFLPLPFYVISSTNPLALPSLEHPRCYSLSLKSFTWHFSLSLDGNCVFSQRPLDKRKWDLGWNNAAKCSSYTCRMRLCGPLRPKLLCWNRSLVYISLCPSI